MAYDITAREKEIENRLRKDYFSEFDAEVVLGDVDFAVAIPQDPLQLFEQEFLLWAEAKKSSHHNLNYSLVQLILTIGKARTFDRHLPPAFLGAFDAEKIAFVPYHKVIDLFSLSYINWNVRPSDHKSETFRSILAKVEDTLNQETLVFCFDSDDSELRTFIRRNFVSGKSRLSKVRINKTNFTAIYQKWLNEVKPTINVNWEMAKRQLILDADFYLADILSEHNMTLRERLRVVLRSDHYELERAIDDTGFFTSKRADFSDRQQAHTQFWNRYERPPHREYWDDIVTRRDLLVPQDIREIRGSYFTPTRWVSLAQEYLSKELGENWQDEYYIWDCCAGTGNLLANLTNKYRIWASTLDKADVDVMHDRIKTMNEASSNGKGSNLLDAHVFQFDFLNDPFTRLPQKLQDIINNPEERRRLIVFINPPYAEAGSTYNHKAKVGVSNTTMAHKVYTEGSGTFAKRELFVQFFMRIYREIPKCILAEFSKLKILQGPYFREFRNVFRAKLGYSFCVPAFTFDNVKGRFPIGFFIWHLDGSEVFKETNTDIYDQAGNFLGKKKLYSYEDSRMLNDWLRPTWRIGSNIFGWLACNGNDFTNQNYIGIDSVRRNQSSTYLKPINEQNLLQSCIYFAVRLCIEATWLNDRDQYLYPNDGWKDDMEFQGDCLVYTLLHGQNRISARLGVNHFIPYTEEEVGAQEIFQSHLVSDMLHGIQPAVVHTISEDPLQPMLFAADEDKDSSLALPTLEQLSAEAKATWEAGLELWQYYHSQAEALTDASFYDIRQHFQGTHVDKKGKEVMNNESTDARYNSLIRNLRDRMKLLELHIAPKVYEYGFLKRNYETLIQRKNQRFIKKEPMPPMDEEALVEPTQ